MPFDRLFHRAVRSALAVAGLGVVTSATAAAQLTEVVFDVAPLAPDAAVGELIGVTTVTGRVVAARIDATFESVDDGPWSLAASFALPTGTAGFDSVALGWSGVGTFETSFATDAFNGELAPPDGSPFVTWFLGWSGGTPYTLPGGGIGVAPLDGVFTRLALTLSMCDCPGPWVDLGHGLAGAVGTPRLSGSGNLCPSAPGALQLAGAQPGGTALLVMGLSGQWLPFLGGTLVPAPDVLLAALPLDGSGAATLPFATPIGLPAGLELTFQAWMLDASAPEGLAASNALRAIVPNDC